MTTTLNQYALAVVRQEAGARGWSRKRLCAEAHIRQVAMRGRKPLDVEEIGRAGHVMGIGRFALLVQIAEGWRHLGPATADRTRRR